MRTSHEDDVEEGKTCCRHIVLFWLSSSAMLTRSVVVGQANLVGM